MAELFSKFINALVLIGLCTVGYFCLRHSFEPVQPPQDPWFQSAVVDQPGPVLVKFGAPWCGPCRMLDPELDKLAMSGGVSVVRIEVEQHPDLARHYHVSSIPRLLLLEHGKVVGDRVGYADYAQLQTWIADNAH